MRNWKKNLKTKRMIKYIGILLFLLTNYLFDSFAPPKSTEWSVFFFSSMYISLFLITLDEAISDHGRITRKIYWAISGVFILRSIYELWLIQLPYKEYIESANSNISCGLFLIVFILFITIIFVKNRKIWLRKLKNAGK